MLSQNNAEQLIIDIKCYFKLKYYSLTKLKEEKSNWKAPAHTDMRN